MATPSTTLLPLSGNTLVDSSTNGSYWILDSSRTLTWALSDFGSYQWLNVPAAVTAISQAYSSYQAFANIKFSYVGHYSAPNSAPADSVFSLDGIGVFFSSTSNWARGYFPNIGLTQAALPTSIKAVYPNAPGDVWLNVASPSTSQSSYLPGAEGFTVILHEIGHTLGLKHPHDGGGTGYPTFISSGESALDVDWATVMSYNESNPFVPTQWHPATPMILDVIAMQALYGPNLSNNAGNDIHRLAANNQYQTIFDPSGIDTIDASGSLYGWDINLGISAANSSHPYSIGLAQVVDNISQPTSLYWLYGQMERVIGSGQADRIVGSGRSELIAGGGGNDYLNGAGGDDTFFGLSGRDAIFGGAGVDALNIGIASSQSTVVKLRTNSFLILDQTGNLAIARDIEKIIFTDGTLDLTTIAPSLKLNAALTQIYVAAFRRAPETGGYNYWVQQEAASDLQHVADTIFSLDNVQVFYPTAMSSAEFVSAIYQNVLNRTPDAEGLNYWINQLETSSRGKLVIDMTSAALSVPDGTSGKDFFQNRLDWSLYAVAYQSLNKEIPTSHLSDLTSGITADPFTVLTLIGQAEAGFAL